MEGDVLRRLSGSVYWVASDPCDILRTRSFDCTWQIISRTNISSDNSSGTRNRGSMRIDSGLLLWTTAATCSISFPWRWCLPTWTDLSNLASLAVLLDTWCVTVSRRHREKGHENKLRERLQLDATFHECLLNVKKMKLTSTRSL